MAVMVFSGVLAWRGYPIGDFLSETQWRRLNRGVGSRAGELWSCKLVQGSQYAGGCIGILERSWLFTEEACLCEADKILSWTMLRFTLPVDQRVFPG